MKLNQKKCIRLVLGLKNFRFALFELYKFVYGYNSIQKKRRTI
jgi:hypothetical protein